MEKVVAPGCTVSYILFSLGAGWVGHLMSSLVPRYIMYDKVGKAARG